MADFKQYDPGLVTVVFKGILLRGFMDGTFVNAERDEDAFSKAAGAGGDITRVRSRNRGGSVTVTLKAESPSNDSLSAVARLDELFGSGVGPLMVRDLNNTTIIAAENAWIRKLPASGYAVEASPREWVFDCAELEMHVGSALV